MRAVVRSPAYVSMGMSEYFDQGKFGPPFEMIRQLYK